MTHTLRRLLSETDEADSSNVVLRIKFANEMIARARQASEAGLKNEAHWRHNNLIRISEAMKSAMDSFGIETYYPVIHSFEGEDGISLPVSPLGICKRVASRLGFKMSGYEKAGVSTKVEHTHVPSNSCVWIPVFYLTRGNVFQDRDPAKYGYEQYLKKLGEDVKHSLRPEHKDDIPRVEFHEWYVGTWIEITAIVRAKRDGHWKNMPPQVPVDAPYEGSLFSSCEPILARPTGRVRDSL